MLGRLRVAHGSVNAERRCTVSDVGTSYHRIEEGWVVVDTNVFDLKWIDFSTRLLVQEVLLHGFIHFLSRHLVLEFPTNGFVNLVHVGDDVLP